MNCEGYSKMSKYHKKMDFTHREIQCLFFLFFTRGKWGKLINLISNSELRSDDIDYGDYYDDDDDCCYCCLHSGLLKRMEKEIKIMKLGVHKAIVGRRRPLVGIMCNRTHFIKCIFQSTARSG